MTTNSISQVFQRRVIEQHLTAKKPMSIVMAIPDHPWTKASPDAAAVRIAMTVGEAGKKDGVFREVGREEGLDTDAPILEFKDYVGKINSDLTIGVDVTVAAPLIANDGICSPGVKLHGAGFIVTRAEAEHLGLGKRPELERHIRDYRNGRDLMARSRDAMVIDLVGLDIEDVRKRFPEVFQHLLVKVKPERENNNEEYRRVYWWLFGRKNTLMRGFTAGLRRYIVTVETSKHRVFQFLPASILPDNKLVAIGSDDAFHLGVLSSKIHVIWATRAGGWLGVGNDSVYVKSRCFDAFPFPDADKEQKSRIRDIMEELDAHRKSVLEKHRDLTLTGLYNVLELLRSGKRPDTLDAGDRVIFDDGLVLVLKELHDRLDLTVSDAYGWPADLADDGILANVLELNRKRAGKESKGQVAWLRPDYQIPLFGSVKERAELDLSGGEMRAKTEDVAKQPFPSDDVAQTASVMAVLASASEQLNADAIASTFKQGRKISPKVRAVLTALARMGFVDTPDGGRSFVLRRAA